MSAKRINTFDPDWSVHPGEILLDELEERGMSQSELATRLGVSAKHVNRIIKGRAGFSASFAVKLETVLGISAKFWLNVQANHDLRLARDRVPVDPSTEATTRPGL